MAPGMKIVKDNPKLSNWSLENGYTYAWNEKEYPKRAYSSFDYLFIILSVYEEDIQTLCQGPLQGFTALVSVPGETSKMDRHQSFLQLGFSQLNVLALQPKLITTSDTLRSYDPNQRKCFFGSERQLRFFKEYTESNCEEECLANFTYIQCGCVKLEMPSTNFLFSRQQISSSSVKENILREQSLHLQEREAQESVEHPISNVIFQRENRSSSELGIRNYSVKNATVCPDAHQ